MKFYDKLTIAVVLLIIGIFTAVNLQLSMTKSETGRQYRVDAERAAYAMSQGEQISPSDYPTLSAIIEIVDDNDLLGGQSDYLIRSIDGKLYRFDYSSEAKSDSRFLINLYLALMAAIIILIMLLVRFMILRPFIILRDVPFELSKGNLIVPLKENRHRLFGRFTWGLNMLKDNLEQQKSRELELLAEKKKLIISLSHDIKIPLSAIKLYSKAIEKGIYSGDKLLESAAKINEKADEIEGFVSQIVKASNEDFLSLSVNEGNFYLSDLMEKICSHYKEKLSLLGTEFTVSEYSNCIIDGDFDRAVEVLQNLMENAIKYGDGKSISIKLYDEEDCRLICVTNSGGNLSDDELPHIFDSFYRGSNVGDKSGSGLGLYICRTLMRKMNGDIFAELHNGDTSVTAVFQKS